MPTDQIFGVEGRETMNWYLHVLKNYAQFTGRARRREYWMFMLINLIVTVLLSFVTGLIGLEILSMIYSLGVLVPSIAVGIRRLHDTDRSGWWLLLVMIPLLGWIALLVITLLDSTPGENTYGPNPKGVA